MPLCFALVDTVPSLRRTFCYVISSASSGPARVRLAVQRVHALRSSACPPWPPHFHSYFRSPPSQLLALEMGANQSKIFRQRRGRDWSRGSHDPGSTPANTPRDIGIENQNSIANTVTGDVVKIFNSNPTTNNVITNNYAAPALEASVRSVSVSDLGDG